MVNPDVCRRAAIAAYEAEMNVIFYTDGGSMEVNIKPNVLHIIVVDRGPGIPDIEKALEPGFSTASDWIRELGFGAGMGLNNIQNCADNMTINSVVDEGTKLDIIINLV
jgi:anti-sigma regulatory factor (Ser/Thr protein kinase)